MFKRLFAVALFALAVSTAQPAHAAALTVDINCQRTSGYDYDYSNFSCDVRVDGGTYQYNYAWNALVNDASFSYATGDGVVTGRCQRGYDKSVTLQVSDNREVVRDTSTFYCY